jgi:hypothetical protein
LRDTALDRCVLYTKRRLDAALRQVEEVRDSGFAYHAADEILEKIAQILSAHYDSLDVASTQPRQFSARKCIAALKDIRVYLPFLGVVVRSAAVRNAFEIYGPLRQMAQRLLRSNQNPDRRIRLILSSGWDFTPLTFRPVEDLKDFIIIVLPASESANPLVVPLAGHELGHSVWEEENLGRTFRSRSADALTSYVLSHLKEFPHHSSDLKGMTLEKAQRRLKRDPGFNDAGACLVRQVEEFFCDFVGLFLFGEAFVHAFTYFLAPNFPSRPSPKYPSVLTRFRQLWKTAKRFESTWKNKVYCPPAKLRRLFLDQEMSAAIIKPGDAQSPSGWSRAADKLAIDLVPEVVQKILDLSSRENWQELRLDLDKGERERIVNRFYRWAVPATNSGGLANILNAAWDVERNPELWENLPAAAPITHKPNLDDERRARSRHQHILSELVLKNIEVLEYEMIVAKGKRQNA